MSHDGFRVVIQLRTPGIISPMLTLDALLAAAKFREMGDLEAAHRELPLQSKDGCWCASMVRFERGAFTRQHWVGRLTPKDMDPDHYTDRNRFGKATVLIGGRTYMPQLDKHLCWAGSISFEGVGDAEEVVRLLGTLSGVGAKSQQGCGSIGSIEWEAIDTDGLRSEVTQQPLRPVPRALWASWGFDMPEGIVVDHVAWKPPYWGSAKEMCVLPVVVG